MSKFKTLVESYLNESIEELKAKLAAPEDLNGEDVKLLLKHPQLHLANGITELSHSIRSLPTEAVGHVVLHAMHQPHAERSTLAHALVSNGHGILTDQQLKHIASSTLGNSTDENLGAKIINAASNKDNMKTHIAKVNPNMHDLDM